MAADRSQLPALGPERAFQFPRIERRTLSNGLRVWTVEHHQVPLVSVLLLVFSGSPKELVQAAHPAVRQFATGSNEGPL